MRRIRDFRNYCSDCVKPPASNPCDSYNLAPLNDLMVSIDNEGIAKLSWEYVTDVDYYDVVFGTDPLSLDNVVRFPRFVTEGVIDMSELVDGTYYFRIDYTLLGGCGTVQGTVPVEVLKCTLQPSRSFKLLDERETEADFSWEPEDTAVSYEIGISGSLHGPYSWTDVGNVVSYTLTGLVAGQSYYVRLRAVKSCGTAEFSDPIFVTPDCNLEPPGNFGTAGVGADNVTLSWQDLGDETSYNLKLFDTVTLETVQVVVAAGVTSYEFTNLVDDRGYIAYISAVRPCGHTEEARVSFNTGCNLDAPTGLVLQITTETTAGFVWNAVTGAVSYSFEYSTLAENDYRNVVNLDSSVNSFLLENLVEGEQYIYRLRAIKSCGTTAYATGSFLLTCIDTPPQNFIVDSVSETSITLRWNLVTDATSYVIEYSTDFSYSSSVTAGVTEQTAEITGLLSGLTYNFRIRAVKVCGDTQYSTLTQSLDCILASPDNLVVSSFTNDTVTLNWVAPPGITDVTGYRIEFSEVSANFENVINLGDVTAHTVTGLAEGVEYKFRVSLIKDCGVSVPSNEVTATTVCDTSAIEGFAITGTTVNSISFSWNPKTSVIQYVLQYGDQGTGLFDNEVLINGSDTTFTLTGVNINTPLEFRIFAEKACGNTLFSPTLTEELLCPVGTPVNFNALSPPSGNSNVYGSRIDFTWVAEPEATGYRIEYSNALNRGEPNPNSYPNNVTIPPSSSYSLIGLDPVKDYYVRIIALYDEGLGACESLPSAATLGQTVCGVEQVEGVQILSTGRENVTLQWQPDPNADYYAIRYSEDTSFSSIEYSLDPSINIYEITGLLPNTSYNFVVIAHQLVEPEQPGGPLATAFCNSPNSLTVTTTTLNDILLDFAYARIGLGSNSAGIQSDVQNRAQDDYPQIEQWIRTFLMARSADFDLSSYTVNEVSHFDVSVNPPETLNNININASSPPSAYFPTISEANSLPPSISLQSISLNPPTASDVSDFARTMSYLDNPTIGGSGIIYKFINIRDYTFNFVDKKNNNIYAVQLKSISSDTYELRADNFIASGPDFSFDLTLRWRAVAGGNSSRFGDSNATDPTAVQEANLRRLSDNVVVQSIPVNTDVNVIAQEPAGTTTPTSPPLDPREAITQVTVSGLAPGLYRLELKTYYPNPYNPDDPGENVAPLPAGGSLASANDVIIKIS